MFSSIGGMEVLMILVVALMVLGPDHLPRVMRTVGKAMGELRKASTEFQRTLNTDIAEEERKAKTAPAPIPAAPDDSAAAAPAQEAAVAAAEPAMPVSHKKPCRPLAGGRRKKKIVSAAETDHTNTGSLTTDEQLAAIRTDDTFRDMTATRLEPAPESAAHATGTRHAAIVRTRSRTKPMVRGKAAPVLKGGTV